MPDEKFEKWNESDPPAGKLRNEPWAVEYATHERQRAWTAALASRSTTPGKLEELIDGLVAEFERIGNLELEPLKLPTRDATMALSGVEKGAQETRKVCAKELAALKAALREAVDAEVATAYAKGASDAQEAADKELAAMTHVICVLIRSSKTWFFEFRMYRDAWLREIGGVIRNKSHEIDGFVLRTRDIYEKGII